MSQGEVKKMKQGMSYSCKEKTIILNVFKYFCSQFPDKCVTELVRRTAKATGCSEKSIFQFRKEEASAEGFKQPSKTKVRKNININSRDIKYDHTVRQAIRSIIYDLRYKNIVPSLNTILKQIKEDASLPTFSLMTLRRLLFDMGFCYEKNGNKCVLVEKDDKNQIKPRNVNSNHSQQDNLSNNCSETSKTIQHYPQNVVNNAQVNNNEPPSLVQAPPMLPTTLPQTNHNIAVSVPVSAVSHVNPHMLEQQPHRLLPMPHAAMSQHQQHMVPHTHYSHNVPMMIGHGMHMQPPVHDHRMPPAPPPAPPEEIHLKRDVPPWIHHHMPMQSIVKQ